MKSTKKNLTGLTHDEVTKRQQQYGAMTEGKSSVFISHRLASTRFCDRVLFLERGRIAEEGTHEELLRKGGGYAAIFAVQSKYYQEGGDEREEAEMA